MHTCIGRWRRFTGRQVKWLMKQASRFYTCRLLSGTATPMRWHIQLATIRLQALQQHPGTQGIADSDTKWPIVRVALGLGGLCIWRLCCPPRQRSVRSFGDNKPISPRRTRTTDIERAWGRTRYKTLSADARRSDSPTAADWLKRGGRQFCQSLVFESRTNYQRYLTDFTGSPTTTGVFDTPNTGIFNPAGIPYPQAFQPGANRLYSFIDFGTRGYLSDRINTHFALRYDQDLTRVDTGSPAENSTETFAGNRGIELLDAEY